MEAELALLRQAHAKSKSLQMTVTVVMANVGSRRCPYVQPSTNSCPVVGSALNLPATHAPTAWLGFEPATYAEASERSIRFLSMLYPSMPRPSSLRPGLRGNREFIVRAYSVMFRCKPACGSNRVWGWPRPQLPIVSPARGLGRVEQFGTVVGFETSRFVCELADLSAYG